MPAVRRPAALIGALAVAGAALATAVALPAGAVTEPADPTKPAAEPAAPAAETAPEGRGAVGAAAPAKPVDKNPTLAG